MTRRWFPLLRSSLAILLILSLTIVLVHWHQERPGQDCQLCYAHQMPGLQSTAYHLLTLPRICEWRFASPEQVLESSAFIPFHFGRAPPSLPSAIS